MGAWGEGSGWLGDGGGREGWVLGKVRVVDEVVVLSVCLSVRLYGKIEQEQRQLRLRMAVSQLPF